MLTNKLNHIRHASQLFSTASFNKIIRSGDGGSFKRRLKKHLPTADSLTSCKAALEHLYSELESNYRSEYFFKNTLLNKLLLQKYSLATTTVLNELPVGGSIADFVLLNGESRIYEIKTDLDGLDKLEKQINDYIRFSNKVYIVASSKHIPKILSEYKKTTVGVIEFTASNTLKEVKFAKDNSSHFDHVILFKTLRKQEYLEILKDELGYTPDVPNTLLFRKCLELAKSIEVNKFQALVFNKLKERKIKCPELLKSRKTPYELKHLCYTLDLSELEYNKFFNFLNTAV